MDKPYIVEVWGALVRGKVASYQVLQLSGKRKAYAHEFLNPESVLRMIPDSQPVLLRGYDRIGLLKYQCAGQEP